MKKKLDSVTVVLYCFVFPAFAKLHPRGAGRFTKENRKRHSSDELVPWPADGDPVSGQGIKMMMATEAEKASAL